MAEPKVVKFCARVGYINSSNTMTYHQQKVWLWSLVTCLKWVTWRGHAHFRYGLSSVGWDLLCSTHVLNFKCLRLPATKKWKAMPNVKILVFSHPLGNLGVTHRVHLWLDGKWDVDFLLAIIAILAISHGCGTINRNLLKSAFSDGGGSLWVQIFGIWGRSQQSIYGLLDRGMM